MNELALFTGGGGGILGSKLLGWKTVCYVEWEKTAQKILKARIKDKSICDAPIWDDIKTFDGKPWTGLVDIVTGGFPCQPFSTAGKRMGADDPRNMWPETIRVISEVEPKWCLLENVAAIVTGDHGYFGVIIGDLVKTGYSVWWSCLSASGVGAPHKRDRVWIMANRNLP